MKAPYCGNLVNSKIIFTNYLLTIYKNVSYKHCKYNNNNNKITSLFVNKI